jgi:hypothetical protein
MSREIIFEFLPLPNLIMHILISADDTKTNRNPKYGDKFETWLTASQRNFLFNEILLKSPRTVETTGTFALLFQWPSYFSGENIESGFEVLEILTKNPSLRSLFAEYPEKEATVSKFRSIKSLNNMLTSLPFSGQKLRKLLNKYLDLIKELWDTTYSNLWKEVKKSLLESANKIKHDYLQNFNFFSAWEEVTGLTYPYSNFSVVGLDSANFLGTSLLAERDCFRLWGSLEPIYRVIIHEIGTHTLIQDQTLTNEKWQHLIETNINNLLRLNEAYCAYKTDQVLQIAGAPESENFVSKHFLSETNIISGLLKQKPHVDIFELLVNASNLL